METRRRKTFGIAIWLVLLLFVGCKNKYSVNNLKYDDGRFFDSSGFPATGCFYKFDDNQKLESRTCFVDGLKQGSHIFWDDNMNIKECFKYFNGDIHGEVKWFHDNGKLRRISNYKWGKKNGIEENFYKSGRLQSNIKYKEGRMRGHYVEWDEEGYILKDTIY